MKKTLYNIFILIFLSACGFKVTKLSDRADYNLIEITSTGEKRVNYILKNKIILGSNKNGTNPIKINLNTKKKKTVKEKNVNNEITKYEITVTAEVTINKIESKQFDQFTLSNQGDYLVRDQHSQTLNNEKKLVRLLSNDLAIDIIDKLGEILNDL